jgi:hypothetical protein
MIKENSQSENFFSIIVFSLIWVLIVFPSTFLATLKISLLLSLFLLFGFKHFQIRTRVSLANYIGLSIFAVLVSVQILRGFLFSNQDPIGPFRSASAIVLVLAVTLTIHFALIGRMLEHKTVIKAIFSGCLFYVSIKLLLLILSLFGLIEPKIFLPYLNSLMPGIVSQIFLGSSNLFRLVTSSDMIVAYIVCIGLVMGKPILQISHFKWNVFLLLGFLSSLLTMTRFIWLLLALSFMFNILTTKRGLYFLIGTTIVLFTVAPIIYESNPEIFDIFSTRTFDVYSLYLKMFQTSQLLEAISYATIVGHGAGAYVIGYQRSLDMAFQYENQWFALCLQYGIPSVFLTWIFIFYRLIQSMLDSKLSSIYLSFLFLLFFLSAFTNPNLTILSSSILYIIFEHYKHFFKKKSTRFNL